MASYPKKGVKLRARICFLDESGISDKPSVRKTWAPKGATPVIRSSGGWKVRSVTGAIVCTPKGRSPRLYLRITKGTIRHPEFIRFLKHLRSHVHRKIILVTDRLPAHLAGKARRFIRQQKSWLTVKWFPSYAPELNPVEYLWSASKRKDYANYCPDTMTELDGCIRNSTKRIRRKPRLLSGFLQASGLFHQH